MLKPGTIVIQDENLINGSIEKNNSTRLSVVLFSENVDGYDVVCSCPITSNYLAFKNHPDNYCYIPFLILGLEKLSIVKVSDLSFWKEETVHPVGIFIDSNRMERIYDKVNCYEPRRDDNGVFAFAKECMSKIDLYADDKEAKRKKRIAKKEKRKKSKECGFYGKKEG